MYVSYENLARKRLIHSSQLKLIREMNAFINIISSTFYQHLISLLTHNSLSVNQVQLIDLMTGYGVINLDQHWIRYGFSPTGPWPEINADILWICEFSVKFESIYCQPINAFTNVVWKILLPTLTLVASDLFKDALWLNNELFARPLRGCYGQSIEAKIQMGRLQIVWWNW